MSRPIKYIDTDEKSRSFNAQSYVDVKDFAEVCRHFQGDRDIRLNASLVMRECLRLVRNSLVAEEEMFESIIDAIAYLESIGISIAQYDKARGNIYSQQQLHKEMIFEDRRIEGTLPKHIVKQIDKRTAKRMQTVERVDPEIQVMQAAKNISGMSMEELAKKAGIVETLEEAAARRLLEEKNERDAMRHLIDK